MRGKLLELRQVSAMCSRWSPVLPVPPLTSTLLGSVEKSRSGIAAGVLNSTRQTGSVLGVALFGSLAGEGSTFMTGTHQALMISAGLLLAAAAAIWRGAPT